MLDPVTTPLLFLVLGKLAQELITDACKDHLKGQFKRLFGWLGKLGEKDKVELAYQDAMEQAYASCLEMLLLNIKGLGYTDEELKHYGSSLEAFIKDEIVAKELVDFVREPVRDDLPSPDVLRERWNALDGEELPSDTLWPQVVVAFRRQAKKRIILSDELRDLLNAQNLQELRELVQRQGGVKVQVRRDRYSQRMKTKFSPVDLANLMPAYADDPGRMVIRDVFVAQSVRENPPPVEIPKDLAERLRKGGRREAGEEADEGLDEEQLEKLRTAYVNQSSRPVLDVIADAGNRLLVLTGDPGAGKSTLMRYLLTGIIEPPVDHESGEPLSWTEAFKEAFPLLIELRDFYALRRSGECDSFLEYVAYMGKTDQWFLDDHAIDTYLDTGPSLVMFDGLDEIFDTGDRDRIMQEIAGFAQRYPRARIVVTSRPVGYKERVLRDAGFAHFGIQDLDDGQVEAFIRGWFALTFPQQPQQAEQRIQRILDSVQKSKPIRLLAGNPMLLTIMALLAREEELPRERAKFYEKAAEVLCHHWDANRNLDLPEDRYLNADDKKALLRRIAMRMQAGEAGLKGNIIQEDDLEQEIQTFLTDEQWQANETEAKKAARRMIRQLRERNYVLCLRGPHLYGFVHRTFLEYLTAADFVHRFQVQQTLKIDELINLFDQHCRDDEWREVLRLVCGQIDEQFVGRIVEHLATRTDLVAWDGRTPLPEVPLAIWCLGEARSLGKFATVGGTLLAKLAQLLEQTSHRFILMLTDQAKYSALSHFLRAELLEAVRELGTGWPGKGRPAMSPFVNVGSVNGMGAEVWSQIAAEIYRDRDLLVHLAHPGDIKNSTGVFPQLSRSYVRSGALQVLAEKWPDGNTRKLLDRRAMQDDMASPRSAALRALAETWPDEETRKLLEGRAVQDEDAGPRSAALEALAETWPDEETRKLLGRRAEQDGGASLRSAALRTLARTWPDEETRKLLERRAMQDEDAGSRGAALQTLARTWPDEEIRKLLERRVLLEEGAGPRSAALQALAETWPDEETRKLLERHAMQDEDAGPRSAALQALAERWPDKKTRKLLEERAIKDGDSGVRRAALESVASNWADENVRKLLEERALRDGNDYTRHATLEMLVRTWPDEKTRKLLEERAVTDGDDRRRRSALETLAEEWPDKRTHRVLRERAGVDGVAASAVGRQHSEFGRIIFSGDLDGRSPHLDPASPISREHIEKAAERGGIPAGKIDETVRSLSEHMGWDITKGPDREND